VTSNGCDETYPPSGIFCVRHCHWLTYHAVKFKDSSSEFTAVEQLGKYATSENGTWCLVPASALHAMSLQDLGNGDPTVKDAVVHADAPVRCAQQWDRQSVLGNEVFGFFHQVCVPHPEQKKSLHYEQHCEFALSDNANVWFGSKQPTNKETETWQKLLASGCWVVLCNFAEIKDLSVAFRFLMQKIMMLEDLNCRSNT